MECPLGTQDEQVKKHVERTSEKFNNVINTEESSKKNDFEHKSVRTNVCNNEDKNKNNKGKIRSIRTEQLVEKSPFTTASRTKKLEAEKTKETKKKSPNKKTSAAFLFFTRSQEKKIKNRNTEIPSLLTAAVPSVVQALRNKKAEFFRTKKKKPNPNS